MATDGEGTLVVTESSVLHPNRNADMTKERMEQILGDELGAERIVWLAKGLADDTTNGHVDNVVAFVGPAACCCRPPPTCRTPTTPLPATTGPTSRRPVWR